MIRKISHSHIDFKKYQNCIRQSEQYLFFAEENYLNTLLGQDWEILVLDDYQAVMPIPLAYKFGFKFVVMPMQTQQLGVFSKNDSAEINLLFSKYLKKKYRVFYYAFNSKNQFENETDFRKNFVLHTGDYSEIRKKYSMHRRRNVRITETIKDKIMFCETKNIENSKNFFLEHTLEKSMNLKNRFFYNMKNLHNKGLLKIYELYFDQKLASLAYLVESDNENFLVNFVNDKSFSKYNTSSILIDQILQKTISVQKLNFHGSNIPAIADFYSRFGSEEQQYHYIENSKTTILLGFLSK